MPARDLHAPRRAQLIAAALSLACACNHVGAGEGPAVQQQARRFVEEGQPQKAIPVLSELHRQAPDDLGVARALAEAYVRAGRADELIDELSRRRPVSAANHYMLGLAYFARSPDAEGPAMLELQAAIALAPERAELHHALALALLGVDRYSEALPSIERAVALSPAQPRMLLTLARACHRTGDFARAVAALRKLLGTRPSRAEIAAAKELMEEIADPFTSVPASARTALSNGLQLLHELDSPQQAIAALEEIARENPQLPIVHTLLALAHEQLDDDGFAVDELKRAIELAPLDGRTFYYLGEVYFRKRRMSQAKECFQRAVELNPLLEDAYLRLGDLALEDQDFVGAQGHFHLAAALLPDLPAVRGKLSLALQRQGNFEAADRELREVLKREPENVEFKLRMGELYLDKRNRSRVVRDREAAAKEAGHWFEQVLKTDPENAIALRSLQIIGAR